MKKILLFSFAFFLLITCKKDAFDEQTEAPVAVYNLAVSSSEGGNVSTSGGSYESGSVVTITATPEQEYVFSGWMGIESTENPLTIAINSDQNIAASFQKRKYPLVVNVNGAGTVQEEIVSTGKSTDYDSGTVVKLTAVPSSDHAFFSWDNSSSVDTINPIQITIDGNKTVGVNFDYQTARDLVGTWEFQLEESATGKSHGYITMRISIQLNILFTMVLNGVTTQIYSQLNSLNSNTFVMGDFGVLTNVSFTSATSLNFNVVTLPPNSSPPTTAASVPSATASNSIGLTGVNKTSSNSAPFIPPTTAVTSSTSGISPTQALSSVVSQVAATTASVTTASTTTISCTISGALTSGPQSQTVTATTAITNVVGTFTTTCSGTLSASATGLPIGVTMSLTNNLATISGSPSAQTSGTYNYFVTASSGTVSASFNGSINVVAAAVSSTTASSCTISGILTSGPQSQTVSISTAITNVVGTFTYTCSDTLSASASGLPTGVSMSFSNNVATISGTPTGTSSGTYNYTVSAVNSTGTASASYSGDITVSVASTTLVPCSGSLTLTSGPSTQTVSASTAITSVNYLVSTNCTDTTTVSATNLPPGVTMNYTSSSGAVVVSGTPSGAATGTYNYSILAMFAPTSDTTASATISGAISIAVATTASSTTVSSCTISGALTSGPQSQTVSISTAITNVVGTFTYTCSDTLSITTSGLPTGVALSTSGNVATISGTPTGAASGTYNYTVSAVNSTGTASASYSGDITVSVASTTLVPCSGSLTLTSGPSTQTVSASTAITSVNYLVSTNCTDTTTVSATNLPPGVTMNYTSSSGAVVVSGTPSGAATGTYNYSILAMFAPTSDATASATISGAISIALATSTTASSSKTFNIGVNATSSSDYTLNGDDRIGTVTGGDPDLTFNTGDTINFNVDATGHPFYLKTAAGTGTGDTISGLTNNGTESATISWTPSATGTFYYQCSLHGGMVGTITIQ